MVIENSPKPSFVLWLLLAILLSSVLLLVYLIIPGIILGMLYRDIINLDWVARFKELSTIKIITGLMPIFAYTAWEVSTLWRENRSWQRNQKQWANTGIIVSQSQEQARQRLERTQKIVSRLKVKSGNVGFIYVLHRSDGIYKIGQAINTEQRIDEHTADYGMGFTLVRRFAVPDKISFEKLALKMTRPYFYREYNRRELRQMSDEQLSQFLTEFHDICMMGVDL